MIRLLDLLREIGKETSFRNDEISYKMIEENTYPSNPLCGVIAGNLSLTN